MSDLTPTRYQIQIEETRPQAAVSESVMSRVGSGINFINSRHVYQHDFKLNGRFNILTLPHQFDGFITYPFAFEIAEVMLFTGSNVGSSGTTELDIKWKPESSGTFSSMFSTTPKFTSAASASDFIRIGQVKAGFTAPVLSKTTFDAYDYLKCEILQATTGPARDVFMKIWILPV